MLDRFTTHRNLGLLPTSPEMTIIHENDNILTGLGDLRSSLADIRSFGEVTILLQAYPFQVLFAFYHLLTGPFYNGDIVRSVARRLLGSEVYRRRWKHYGFNINIHGKVVQEDFRDNLNLRKRDSVSFEGFDFCIFSSRSTDHFLIALQVFG